MKETTKREGDPIAFFIDFATGERGIRRWTDGRTVGGET
jgi:hypothetical protein